ncbi:MAG: hypothetical protein ICV80_23045 [Microcoleus sp. T1-bin1]|nr:hypothetical protein [Microcoleus sp. T1-bin1]
MNGVFSRKDFVAALEPGQKPFSRMPSSFCLWAVNAVSSTSYLKKVNIPDRANHSSNKPLTKIKRLPDNYSPLLVEIIAKNDALIDKYKIHRFLQNNCYQFVVRTEVLRVSVN